MNLATVSWLLAFALTAVGVGAAAHAIWARRWWRCGSVVIALLAFAVVLLGAAMEFSFPSDECTGGTCLDLSYATEPMWVFGLFVVPATACLVVLAAWVVKSLDVIDGS